MVEKDTVPTQRTVVPSLLLLDDFTVSLGGGEVGVKGSHKEKKGTSYS